jgi:hypothetical protein
LGRLWGTLDRRRRAPPYPYSASSAALAIEGFEGVLTVEAQVRDWLALSIGGVAASRRARAAAPGRGRRRACLGRAPRVCWSWIRCKSGSRRVVSPSALGVEAGAGGGRAAGWARRLMAVVALATPDAATTMWACPGSMWALWAMEAMRMRACLPTWSQPTVLAAWQWPGHPSARVWALGGSWITVVPSRWSGDSRRWRHLAVVCFFGYEGSDEAGER